MSTEIKDTAQLPPLSLREVSELLVRHYGLTEGQFDLVISYQVGAGAFGPSPEQAVPGLAVSVQQIALVPAQASNPLTIDASKVGRKRRKALG